MIGLTTFDYLLFPIYFAVVFFIFKKLRVKYKSDARLYLYFTWGFRIKIAIIIAYTFLSHFVIRGDAVDLYYGEGKNFAQIIKDNPAKINLLFTKGGAETDKLASDEEKGYLAMESNYMVVKISILFCFVSFSCFLIVNLLIGFIAFLCSWQLYLFFLDQYPKLHKEFAFATMGIPTVLFWSAGISKDTICVSLLALLTKSLYDIFIKRRKLIVSWLIVIITLYIIYQVKSYIIISYMPFFMMFLILARIKQTKNVLLRYLLGFSLPLIFISLLIFLAANSDDLLKEYSSEKVLEGISNQQKGFNAQAERTDGAFFNLGEFDGSVSGLAAMAPKALIATFFRPFIWESRNLIMLLSSLEAVVMLIFTLSLFLKSRGFLIFFSSLFKNALVLYCIAFAILFGIFVGISTFNFGSLVRYKIPCIPFFVCGLIIIKERIAASAPAKVLV
jgi:hypothetical protein